MRPSAKGINILTVLVLLLMAASSSYTSIKFPSEDCEGSKMAKVMFNQTGYIQYIEYVTKIPRMKSFTCCYWVNFRDPQKTATLFNYALNPAKNNTNTLTLQWSGGRFPTWDTKFYGELVASFTSQPLEPDTWHHVCQTWDNAEGLLAAFMDGAFLGAVFENRLRGLIIPGGGQAVSGQHQNTLFNGMDVGQGLEGWMVLFQFDSHPISYPSTEETAAVMRSLARQCQARDLGNIIGWVRTPRKGYGGVMHAPSKEICHNF